MPAIINDWMEIEISSLINTGVGGVRPTMQLCLFKNNIQPQDYPVPSMFQEATFEGYFRWENFTGGHTDGVGRAAITSNGTPTWTKQAGPNQELIYGWFLRVLTPIGNFNPIIAAERFAFARAMFFPGDQITINLTLTVRQDLEV